MSDSDTIDYTALAEKMLGQWQKESAEYMRNPQFLKAMMEAMQPFAGSSDTTQMMQQMQRNMKAFCSTASAKPDGDGDDGTPPAYPSAYDAMDADELAWLKQRLAACEGRIAMLEAKVD